MKRRYKIDYDQRVDCFAAIRHVESDLIYGDLNNIKNPYISYIIPVYKRADLLKETLDSVLGQIEVSFAWDIVVVDNEAGGENDTERLIRKIDNPRILYYRNRENIGVDGNYNRCIELARGEWVAMLHGDDLIMNDHLSEMARLIKETEHKDKKIAYVCQRYKDFSNVGRVRIDRPLESKVNNELIWLLTQDFSSGKLLRQYQIDGVLTGYFAALPSFGTMMKREVMLAEGGFNENLGICEDVITPYKLAKKYGVYLAPKVMGYHRFDENESTKLSTIIKIYDSMTDFREYMYSKIIITKIWAMLARDIHNKDLQNYCIGLSRFSERKLTSNELNDVFPVRQIREIAKKIYGYLLRRYRKLRGIKQYNAEYMIEAMFMFQETDFLAKAKNDKIVLVYGAGKVAKKLVGILQKKYKFARIIACAVSDINDAHSQIEGIRVLYIDDVKCDKTKTTVITATKLWEYQIEMNKKLAELGYNKIVNLLQ